jgi:hypothetical protein
MTDRDLRLAGTELFDRWTAMWNLDLTLAAFAASSPDRIRPHFPAVPPQRH